MTSQRGANLSYELGLKGAKAMRVNTKRLIGLKVKELQAMQEATAASVVKTALQSPVIAGGGMYLLVHVLESATVAQKATAEKAATAKASGAPPAPRGQATNDWVANFAQALASGASLGSGLGAAAGLGAGLGSLASAALTPGTSANTVASQIASGQINLAGLFAGLDFAALKLAILIYVASGGNLAGTLQSAGGILGDLFKAGGALSVLGA